MAKRKAAKVAPKRIKAKRASTKSTIKRKVRAQKASSTTPASSRKSKSSSKRATAGRTTAKKKTIKKSKGRKTSSETRGSRSGRATSAKKGVKKNASPKKTASAKPPPQASGMVIPFPDESRKVPKTHLSAKQLQEYKQVLLGRRAELAGDVTHLTNEVVNREGRGSSDHTSMPIHMADVGSDNWEKEFTIGLIANERTRIRDIDDALERIANKTYGVCLATHRKISIARLLAKPWAKYCIEYARAREEGRAR